VTAPETTTPALASMPTSTLRQLLRHAPAAIAMLDLDLRYVAVSDRFRTDYQLGDQPLEGRMHYDVLPHQPECWRATHRRVLLGAVERCDDDRIVAPDGTETWLAWEARPWHTEAGAIGGIVLFSQMMGPRVAAERERSRLTHALQERVKELTVLHQTGRLLAEDRAIDQPLLIELAHLLPPAWQYPEITAARVWTGSVEARTEGYRATPWSQSATFDTLSGLQGGIEVVYLEERPPFAEGPFLSEERSLIASLAEMLRAHGERIAAQEARRKAESTLSSIFLTAPVGIIISDASSCEVVDLNHEAERLLGHRRDDARGVTTLDLGIWPDRAMRDAFLALALAPGGLTAYEANLLRKDRTEIPLRVSSHPLRIEGRTCLLSAFVDLTELRAQERERRSLELRLHHAQRLEAVGRLAAGVSHDFNNILAAISITSELLREELAGTPQAPLVSEIEGATQRASALIKQLLAFSRQQVMVPQRVDVAELVRGLAPMLERLIKPRCQLELRTDGMALVLADPGQLEQVILNLAMNARDAMPDGGPVIVTTETLTYPCDAIADDLGLAPGTYVCLSVKDAGAGIDAATRARMFEPFFTTKASKGGTGLGLATVYGIVRQSGGAIEVVSEPNQGASFHVLLPVSLGEQPPSQQGPC
jgi:PAS domain S-box-containing protein